MRTLVSTSFVLVLCAAPASAQGRLERLKADWKRFRAEQAIERTMLLGHVRGFFGKRPPPPDWTPRVSGKGRLERGPGGVPILYLAGSPEAMGRQHGALMRREILAMRTYVSALVGRRRLPAARRRASKLFLEHCSDDTLREARGLAEASGLPLEEVLFAQWFTDIYRAFACSTLSAPSAEGALLARNLDFPSMGFLERYSIVIVARPEGKRPYVSVSWPGLLGVLSGQNAGLALSVMVVHDEGGARSGLPFQLAFRRVLEEAGDVKEAEALLRRLPITVTNNLMLVDSGGGARVLELHPDGIVARSPNRSGRLVSTNHFVSRERRQARASFSYFSSRRRFLTVERACRGEGPVSLTVAKRALGKAATSFTVQSMIFLPREGAVEVAFTKRAPATRNGQFVRLSREVLLGSD